ncbi:hypothetical protein OIP52_000708 [Salmonella enterica]|nr:hypothetical protein [Salmonella enterica]
MKPVTIETVRERLSYLEGLNERGVGTAVSQQQFETACLRELLTLLVCRPLPILPPLNDDLIAILGRPNFTCSHLAELMRKSGDEIRRKSEHEQAAVIHWFLGIYLEHGDKWEGVAKADIQSRVAAAGIGVKGE